MPLIPIASCTYWVVLECSCNSTRRGWGACAEVLKSLIRFQLLGRGTAHLVSLTPSSASLSSPSSFWIYRTRTYLNTNLIVALGTMKKIMMTMNGGEGHQPRQSPWTSSRLGWRRFTWTRTWWWARGSPARPPAPPSSSGQRTRSSVSPGILIKDQSQIIWDFDHVQLSTLKIKVQLWSVHTHLHTKCAVRLWDVSPAERACLAKVAATWYRILILMSVALAIRMSSWK